MVIIYTNKDFGEMDIVEIRLNKSATIDGETTAIVVKVTKDVTGDDKYVDDTLNADFVFDADNTVVTIADAEAYLLTLDEFTEQ